LTLAEYMEVSAFIQGKVDEDAKVVLGVIYDETLGDELRVTVIATGIGNVVKKNETISLVEEARKPLKLSTPQEVATAPAPANPRPAAGDVMSPSHFGGFDTIGGSGARAKDASRNPKEMRAWNEDYLETPTYLRKKAN
jgi:cell division protein FtsZ